MTDLEKVQGGIKLNGENWVVWKFQTSIVLKSKEYFKIATGEEKIPTDPTTVAEWVKKDTKVQEILVSRMDEGPLSYLLSCETSAEMWAKLNSIYEQKSQVSVHLLQQKFFSLEFKEGNVSNFISQLEGIKSQLKQAGEEVSEKMIMTKVLMALPESFRHFVSAWESVASESQN